jgi:hypothetical protein
MSRRTSLAAITLALTAPLLVCAPAHASGGGDAVVNRGSCSGSTDWKLKVKPDDGRIELEAEVDSDRNGQVWHWKIRHNDSLSASGTGTTAGDSGSFEVHRRMSNLAGTDRFAFRAVYGATGEICRGTIML